MKKIFASIITIGDELLIGQVIDTNSAFIAQELNKIGVAVKHRLAVGDGYEDIWNALDEESKHASIVLITGGLGPTADDITKPLLCKYFGGNMVLHQPTLDHVTYLFNEVFKRPGALLERNRKQAEVPDVATVLKNEVGTAPGLMFEKNGTIFIAMPGVPHEMKWITSNHVIPLIKQKFETGFIEHRTLLTQGIGESMLAEMIQDWEEKIPSHIKLAYLPNFGMVRLRLTGNGVDKDVLNHELDKEFAQVKILVKDYLIADADIPMEQVVAQLLQSKNKTLATAESCTGGHIASLFTQHAGASSFFTGTVVCYDNRIKTTLLGVPKEILTTVGAVSKETVELMATNIIQLMQTDYSIAVSGIMGPGGATDEKPVGLVWIAVANREKVIAQQFNFRFDRTKNIHFTAINGLNMLRKLILE
ncbi:MAG: CinA family nicotinamide mononucleotide deamidase-related protein [Chitinophagaceae bacterium]|nr:CinA family nicotinamide mononucleotide deamidase-related protein [Chitinophagaceae bacterium]